ncbi:MAG: hypothetical protein LBR50_00625 [Tannerella sp.]|jgi:hypothetical protein|nr:hypothetical protein [Tannerella sp.]
MESKNTAKRDKIIAKAKHTKYYCDLIIDQSDKWLTAEEGNRVMQERILKKKSENEDEELKL